MADIRRFSKDLMNQILTWRFTGAVSEKTVVKKIYFAGSIRGGRQDGDLYGRLIEQLQCHGEVLTEIVSHSSVEKAEMELHGNDFKRVHDQDMDWLNACDCVVAEVTQPSLGVGYEIGRAIELEKNILCLFRPNTGKKLSAMIQGAENGTSFVVRYYQEEESASIFREYFDSLKMKKG